MRYRRKRRTRYRRRKQRRNNSYGDVYEEESIGPEGMAMLWGMLGQGLGGGNPDPLPTKNTPIPEPKYSKPRGIGYKSEPINTKPLEDTVIKGAKVLGRAILSGDPIPEYDAIETALDLGALPLKYSKNIEDWYYNKDIPNFFGWNVDLRNVGEEEDPYNIYLPQTTRIKYDDGRYGLKTTWWLNRNDVTNPSVNDIMQKLGFDGGFDKIELFPHNATAHFFGGSQYNAGIKHQFRSNMYRGKDWNLQHYDPVTRQFHGFQTLPFFTEENKRKTKNAFIKGKMIGEYLGKEYYNAAKTIGETGWDFGKHIVRQLGTAGKYAGDKLLSHIAGQKLRYGPQALPGGEEEKNNFREIGD